MLFPLMMEKLDKVSATSSSNVHLLKLSAITGSWLAQKRN